MLDDPVRQRLLEADVLAGFLGFKPFVAKNLLAFSLELAVERGILQQIVRQRWFFCDVRHKIACLDKLNFGGKFATEM